MLHPRCLTVGGPKMTTAKDIIDGIAKVIDIAHDNDIKIYVSKLTPFKGWGKFMGIIDDFKWTIENQGIVDDINSWIGTSQADGIIDIDFIKDETDPEMMKKEYAIDNLHYNEKAQKIFIDSIDESYLR